MKYSGRITISIEPETKGKARFLAERSNRTLAGYARWLIKQAIREYEALNGPIAQKGRVP